MGSSNLFSASSRFHCLPRFRFFRFRICFRSSHCKLISRLGDFNESQTHNHLVCKLTLNQLAKLTSLAKWLSVRLQTKWLRVRFRLQPRIYVIAAVLIITRCHSRIYWEDLPVVSREVRRSRLFQIFVV